MRRGAVCLVCTGRHDKVELSRTERQATSAPRTPIPARWASRAHLEHKAGLDVLAVRTPAIPAKQSVEGQADQQDSTCMCKLMTVGT